MKKILFIIFISIVAIFGLLIYYFSTIKMENMILGTNFNVDYTEYLGLDPKDTFKIILDDLKFKYIRLAVQWDKAETERGKYDFSETDYFMDEAAKRNVKVVLAVGQKIPRWPECHIPAWAKNIPDGDYESAILDLIDISVKRYKNHPALEIWQVENEPYLVFGECRKVSDDFLPKEVALVKSIDGAHPTLVTDSGELSFWGKASKAADLFGTTMYRVVWSEYLGYWSYDWLPPAFYHFKLWLNGRDPKTAYVMELQAEPWIPNQNIHDVALEEQYKSMNLKRLEKNLEAAKGTGMSRAYLWGAEWWIYAKKLGAGEIYEYIKNIDKE